MGWNIMLGNVFFLFCGIAWWDLFFGGGLHPIITPLKVHWNIVVVDKLRKFYLTTDCCKIRAIRIRTYTSPSRAGWGTPSETWLLLASDPLPRMDEYRAPFMMAVGVPHPPLWAQDRIRRYEWFRRDREGIRPLSQRLWLQRSKKSDTAGSNSILSLSSLPFHALSLHFLLPPYIFPSHGIGSAIEAHPYSVFFFFLRFRFLGAGPPFAYLFFTFQAFSFEIVLFSGDMLVFEVVFGHFLKKKPISRSRRCRNDWLDI